MKTKVRFKKGIVLALSATLVMGVAPMLPGVGTKAKANEQSRTPSVSVYADKNRLTDDTFTPEEGAYWDYEPYVGKIGKLKFGKVDGTAIEWYILGPDKNIDDGDNNIAIFAASNIIASQLFNDSYEARDYTGDDDEEYVKGGDPESITANHYGESDIRTELRKMSGDEEDSNNEYDYFTPAEKEMMQKTKVLTHERNSTDKLYTTNDRLYLASGEYGKDKVIHIGNVSKKDEDLESADECTGIELYYMPYWNSSNWFWLRSPYPNDDLYELVPLPGTGKIDYYTGHLRGKGVRPASNLNLTNVLFASAAEASTASETGTCKRITESGTDQAAMTLRMDGSDETTVSEEQKLGGTLGKVELIGDTVKVIKGTTKEPLTLIIQYRIEDEDWYFAKKISEDITTMIVTDVPERNNFDPLYSKIWLEATGNDELIYAVEATRHNHKYDDTWTEKDGNQHGHKCTDPDCPYPNESFIELEGHTWGDDNVCTKCGYMQGVHIVTKVERKEPTSKTVGYKEHFECSHCDQWFIYPATLGALFSEDKSYFEIPATGGGSSSGGTTYSDGSTKNSDRYVSGSSSGSGGGSGSSSGGSALTNLSSTTGGYTGWTQDTAGRWWYYNAGTKVVGWAYDTADGKWYYCDEQNGMLTGWYYDTATGYWYYLDAASGAMLTGWQLIGGKQYYFAPVPPASTYSYDYTQSKWVYSNESGYRPYGSMYAGTTTPDNQSVGADGVKIG